MIPYGAALSGRLLLPAVAYAQMGMLLCCELPIPGIIQYIYIYYVDYLYLYWLSSIVICHQPRHIYRLAATVTI